MAEKAILVDVSRCIGDRACQVACKQWHDLPGESTRMLAGSYQNPPNLSYDTWTLLRFKELPGNGDNRWLFRKHQCMHCTDAACVRVCPVDALSHHKEMGFVSYDRDKCIGCGYCGEFCPFGVPKLDVNAFTGQGKMNKCVFCQDRVTHDLPPACVKACPTGALQYGERQELLEKGRARVRELSADYPEATLYGETELGGLHYLYVLRHTAETYDLPADPDVPLAATFWQDVIKPLGWVVVGGTAAALAINFAVATLWVRGRRMSGGPPGGGSSGRGSSAGG